MDVQPKDLDIKPQTRPVWSMIMLLIFGHVFATYGLYLAVFHTKWETLLYSIVILGFTRCGMACATHRCFVHGYHAATTRQKFMIIVFQTMAAQLDMMHWVKLHRLRHKFAYTDADPLNANRGFFLSHIGWLLVTPHPEVSRKVKQIDLSDVYSDPVLRFQRRFYVILLTYCSFFTTIVPVYVWNESWASAFFVTGILRSIINLHVTLFINSKGIDTNSGVSKSIITQLDIGKDMKNSFRL